MVKGRSGDSEYVFMHSWNLLTVDYEMDTHDQSRESVINFGK